MHVTDNFARLEKKTTLWVSSCPPHDNKFMSNNYLLEIIFLFNFKWPEEFSKYEMRCINKVYHMSQLPKHRGFQIWIKLHFCSLLILL